MLCSCTPLPQRIVWVWAHGTTLWLDYVVVYPCLLSGTPGRLLLSILATGNLIHFCLCFGTVAPMLPQVIHYPVILCFNIDATGILTLGANLI